LSDIEGNFVPDSRSSDAKCAGASDSVCKWLMEKVKVTGAEASDRVTSMEQGGEVRRRARVEQLICKSGYFEVNATPDWKPVKSLECNR